MMKKYTVNLLAASVAAGLSFNLHANGFEVIDVGPAPDALTSVGQQMNEAGHAVVVNTNIWDQNIRWDLLDEDEFAGIDLENPSENDYRRVRNALNNAETFGASPRYQKLGGRISHVYDGQIRPLTGFDQIDPETGELTDSVNVIAHDINLHGTVVGQATQPYERRLSTDGEGEEVMYFIRDSFPQGFIKQGETINYVQGDPDMPLGGTASVLRINDHNQAVGYASVAPTHQFQLRLELCDDEETQEEFAVCVWRFWNQNEVINVAAQNARDPVFQEVAYAWDFDHSGNLIEQRPLGVLAEPVNEDDRTTYRSAAYDINNNGIAVGRSHVVVEFSEDRHTRYTTAVAFRDGDIINLFENGYVSTSNVARAINNENMIVGSSMRSSGFRTSRDRLFYYDLNSPDAEPVYPTGFFNTSGWTPRAINDNNIVVGRGEVSTAASGTRPTVGFMYDIATDEITDLNTLLPCGSEYRIVEAVDINNAGEILATAAVTVNYELDGEPLSQEMLRSVRLQPASVSSCPENPQENERQGAAVHPLFAGLLALAGLFITRRKYRQPK